VKGVMTSSTVPVFRNLAAVFKRTLQRTYQLQKKGEGGQELFDDLIEYFVFAKTAALNCLIIVFIVIKDLNPFLGRLVCVTL
jgi:hypothetical protein